MRDGGGADGAVAAGPARVHRPYLLTHGGRRAEMRGAAAGLARAGRLKWPYIVVGDDACIQKCSCTLGKEERNIYSTPFIDTTYTHAHARSASMWDEKLREWAVNQ